ncbi:MAG TPA: M23 family metallopeptidase, partial [Saprospiraceae bacterium]|nr:M23 family metallopeptidase [Saprospiraceae bacterium]
APAGTPILAVGDGVVVEAAYGKGNGNYVKIKHDGTYTTQSLHMKGFAKGIRRGVHVQQGQTIGYVGSTGLATGPHVCFRFWKNGQQVNHLKLTMPPPKPLDPEVMPEFILKRDEYVKALSLARLETLRQGEIETSIQQP